MSNRIRSIIGRAALVGAGAALAAAAVVVLATVTSAQGPGALFVDADDLACTDDPSESAGASGTPFCSIQAAIDFIEETTPTGGKLTLRAAEYDEAITTNHGDLLISGDSAVLRSSIVIRPSGEDDIGIHVTDPLGVCDNLTIQHVTIDGTGHHSNGQGILVDDVCEPITIIDVEVSGWTKEGILFADSSGDEAATATDNSSISMSIVRDNGRAGIELHQGTNNTLDDLDVSGNGADGISLITETNAQITHSQIANNGFIGLSDFEGTNTVVRDNAVNGNAADGLLATGPHSGLRIEDNDVLDNGGLGVYFRVGLFGAGGTNTSMVGNRILGNRGGGIQANLHAGLSILDNDVVDNLGVGVVLDDGTDALVRLNTIERNGAQGVHALDQTGLRIESNNIDDNGDHGVEIARGDDNTVSGNTLNGNAASGLRADDSVNISLTGNVVIGNESIGIALFDGTDTLVQTNDIADNGEHGIEALRELALTISSNDVRDNALTGIRLVDGTNGRVVGNHEIADNGAVGAAEDYGLSVNGETNLLIEKNIFRRNFDAQILVNSSSDVAITKNDFETAVDGIILVDQLAHPFIGLVIGGSAGDGNRFRGLDPATNACDTEADSCYIELPQQIIGLGTIEARYNDWGTTNLDEIENLICHAGESPCGLNTVDFSNPLQPGDSPTTKDAVPGDVDCSGSVNSIDAALLLQRTAGLIDSLPCAGNADVNGDGNANSLDAALILQFSAGLIDSL